MFYLPDCGISTAFTENSTGFFEKYIFLFSRVSWCTVFSCIVAFLVWDTWDRPYRLVSAGGLLVFVFLGYLCSKHRSKVRQFLGTKLFFIQGRIQEIIGDYLRVLHKISFNKKYSLDKLNFNPQLGRRKSEIQKSKCCSSETARLHIRVNKVTPANSV